jgi:hypothetical protein
MSLRHEMWLEYYPILGIQAGLACTMPTVFTFFVCDPFHLLTSLARL